MKYVVIHILALSCLSNSHHISAFPEIWRSIWVGAARKVHWLILNQKEREKPRVETGSIRAWLTFALGVALLPHAQQISRSRRVGREQGRNHRLIASRRADES